MSLPAIDEDELQAFVDGRLPQGRSTAVLAHLDRHPARHPGGSRNTRATRMSCAAALAAIEPAGGRPDHAAAAARARADRLTPARLPRLAAPRRDRRAAARRRLVGPCASTRAVWMHGCRRWSPRPRRPMRCSAATASTGRADRGLADRDGGLVLAPARRGDRDPLAARDRPASGRRAACCPATSRRSRS